MPKKKIAVAMSEWVLIKLDEAADEYEVSRSALVEEAVTDYVVRRAAVTRDEEYQRHALAALEDAKRLAREWAENPANANAPSSLEVLREIRNEE